MSEQPSNDPLIEPRRDYTADSLRRDALADDPLAQFTAWLADARAAKLIDATAMVLATVDNDTRPHSRVVLLKRFDADGFVWYTYQDSDKGRQLEAHPVAALLFYWSKLERQVRIEGRVRLLDPTEADDYFHSRPDGSRFSAAASQQSEPVADRGVLEARVTELHERHPEGDVPRPPIWGGYCLIPDRFEFWQGRADRLHDRFEYARQGSGRRAPAGDDWSVARLQP